MNSIRYPAQFTPASEGGFVVTFRDVPEAITQGDSMDEAMEMAEDALIVGLSFYSEFGRPIPNPSVPEVGEILINVPAQR